MDGESIGRRVALLLLLGGLRIAATTNGAAALEWLEWLEAAGVRPSSTLLAPCRWLAVHSDIETLACQ